MRDKIVVIGSLNYDIILKMPRLPKEGETLPANDAAFSAGGKGANQAVQAAKLGVPAYLIGCVGNDSQGTFLLETAEKYGVHTDYMKCVEGPSGMGIVNAVEDGSVFASIVRGANFRVTKEHIDEAVPLLEEAKLVILQMEIPLEINEYAIDVAKRCGCKVLLNAAPAMDIEEEYLKKIDILVVNEVEAGFYLKETIDSIDKAKEGARKLSEKLGIDCIFTLGKDGSVVVTGNETEFIPSHKVKAIETTGAGDSFIGGLGYALLEGQELIPACRFATGCSAITVCRLGAQDSMPTLREVLEK
ncbi:MAG: ribokinase [Lachnospiraceae bacterium]|nr:ribokinase [Lachnospiraceae bacterium]